VKSRLFEPSSQVSHYLIVRHGATGRDARFACMDFLEDIDLILDFLKGGIVGQTIQQLLKKLLGRHNRILYQQRRNWYPLLEEYRTAVRTFLASSPLEPGPQVSASNKNVMVNPDVL
jgi:hypothetical protein